ncbi:12008_t:CDS:2, partial [Racocetra persica]
KYFFHADEKPCIFIAGDIIFISEKYIVENFEQCVTVGYASTLDSENSTHEFDIPLCAPHSDDIKSITTETLLKHPVFVTSSTSSVKHNTTITNANQNYIDLDVQSKEKEKHLDCSINEKATELYEVENF